MVRELIIDPELEKCLPPLPEVQFQKLRASIEKKYDPAKPIVLWKERPNTIVDGHHRYKICQEFGVEPVTIEESFASLDDAVLYTLQRQVEQRNLASAQLVSVYEQMLSIEYKQRLVLDAKENSGVRTDLSPSEGGRSKEVARRIAERAGVNPSTVYSYHAVKENGAPELTKLVESGEVGVESARIFVRNEPDIKKQSSVISSGGAQAVRDIALDHRRTLESERKSKKELEKQLADIKERAQERREIEEYKEVLTEQFGGAKYSCGLSSVHEMWCNDCKIAFDVFKPAVAKCCPVCSGINIVYRDESWYPGKRS